VGHFWEAELAMRDEPEAGLRCQTSRSRHGEVVTINTDASPRKGAGNWNGHNLNQLARNNWRTSLVPAPAVIPAPIAYIKVVAVKKLVVEFQGDRTNRSAGMVCTVRSAFTAGAAPPALN